MESSLNLKRFLWTIWVMISPSPLWCSGPSIHCAYANLSGRGVVNHHPGGWYGGMVLLKVAEFLGTGDGFNPAMNVEFVIDVFEVPLDGVDREIQLDGRFPIGQTGGNEAQHF